MARVTKLWILVALGMVIAVVSVAACRRTQIAKGAGDQRTRPSQTPPAAQPVRNKIGIELLQIPAGSFMMGSDTGRSDEKPVHRVTISNSFFMSKYEVTQMQWQALMGNNPSEFKGNNLPVENVTWNDSQGFIRKLNQLNDGFAYRLPTEAEWEYACRAGTTGDHAGDTDSMAWYSNNAGRETHPVGSKQPNTFGLYDMNGNVWEWCQDWYHEDYYRNSPGKDPRGPSVGTPLLGQPLRILRGGSWLSGLTDSRSANRNALTADFRDNFIGFRVAATRRSQ